MVKLKRAETRVDRETRRQPGGAGWGLNEASVSQAQKIKVGESRESSKSRDFQTEAKKFSGEKKSIISPSDWYGAA